MTKKVKKEIQIVLNKTVPKLGLEGTLLQVKSGYARNFLLPNKTASLVTPTILHTLTLKKKKLFLEEEKLLATSLKLKNLFEKKKTFFIEKRVGAGNKIFGKITSKQIQAILEENLEITLPNLTFSIPDIKEVGIYSIKVFLQPNITTEIQLEIISK